MRIGIDVREIEKAGITGIGRYLSNILYHITGSPSDNEYVLFAGASGKYCERFGKARVVVIKRVIPLGEISRAGTMRFLSGILAGVTDFIWDQIQLPAALKKENIDVFFSPYYKRPCFIPCRSIITIHDLNPLFLESGSFINFIRYRLYFPVIMKLSVRKADCIITVSQFSKKDIVDKFGVAGDKIEVIYNGVDERYQPLSESARAGVLEKYNIRKKYVLYIGNFNPHKNVGSLIKAYALLPEHLRNNCQLVLGGKKDSRCLKLERMAGDLGIKSGVVFPGVIGENDMAAVYGAARVFVFLSLREGFGLPLLEAMACGTAVVSSNLSSLPEVAGDAAIYVDPYDIYEIKEAISKILDDDELKEDLVKKGLARSKEFPSQKSADRILEVFEQLKHNVPLK